MTLSLAFVAFTLATTLGSGAAAFLWVWAGPGTHGGERDASAAYDIRTW